MPPWSSSRSWRPNATPDPPRGSEQLGDDREAGRPPRRPDQAQGPQRRAWPALRRLLFGPLGLVLLIAGLVWYLSLDLADLQRVSLDERQPEITLQDRAGAIFARFGDSHGEYLALAQISPWLPKAVIAIEDRRFYQHPGIDPIGIGRAFVRNVQAGRVIQGRQHDQPAAGEDGVPHARTQLAAQGQGGALHLVDRGALRQSEDPRALSEPGLSRQRGVRGRCRCAALFRPAGERSDPGRGGHARGPDQGAVALCADARSRARARPRRGGAEHHGRDRLDHAGGRGGGQGCARAGGSAAHPRRHRLLRRLGVRREPTVCRCGSAAPRGAHHARSGSATRRGGGGGGGVRPDAHGAREPNRWRWSP